MVYVLRAGCERCSCDMTGSVNGSCDISTGNCYCQPGVSGRRCDQCMPFYYGFSRAGCKREFRFEFGECEWFGSLVVRASDLRLNGREFDPRPPHYLSVGIGMDDRLWACCVLAQR